MRIAIASRIFQPEPSAAAFRLGALADALVRNGDDVTVLTVTPPPALRDASQTSTTQTSTTQTSTTSGADVRRFPVLRDSSGYVRGYVPYMSFDVPLFFRILLGRRRDLLVVEPPPTTGAVVRIAAAIRRVPYAYYAADLWADATQQTEAPGWVVRVVRGLERFALSGAQTVLSVSPGVTGRLAELGITDRVETIGNGIDVRAFVAGVAQDATGLLGEREASPTFVYAGTASEWHGAGVFVEAMPAVLEAVPAARLRFIGGGSERDDIEQRAADLGIAHAVSFDPVMAPAQLAPLLRHSAAAVASVRPGAGYDFAFPTKLYSAAACGAPLIYSGIGPAVEFVQRDVDGEPLGAAVPHEPAQVAAAMIRRAQQVVPESRRERVAAWAAGSVSLDAVAATAAAVLRR